MNNLFKIAIVAAVIWTITIALSSESHAECPGYAPFPNYSGSCDTEAEAVDAASAFCAEWDAKAYGEWSCSFCTFRVIYLETPGTYLGYVAYLGYQWYPSCDEEVVTPGFHFKIRTEPCKDDPDPCCGDPTCGEPLPDPDPDPLPDPPQPNPDPDPDPTGPPNTGGGPPPGC